MGKVYGKDGGKGGRLTVVATPEELRLAPGGAAAIVTGVGALNVLAALQWLPRDTPILNIGFAGSGRIPVGTAVPVTECDLYHPGVEYMEPSFRLEPWEGAAGWEGGGIVCHTITDFGGDPSEKNCVYDMELAFILGMGFRDVRAVKVVSDNCSYEEYEETIKKLV